MGRTKCARRVRAMEGTDQRSPYNLVAARLPCASRLHWREHKLAALKQVFALSNEGCDARLHRRGGEG